MRLDGKRRSVVDVIVRELMMRDRKKENVSFSDLGNYGCSFPHRRKERIKTKIPST